MKVLSIFISRKTIFKELFKDNYIYITTDIFNW